MALRNAGAVDGSDQGLGAFGTSWNHSPEIPPQKYFLEPFSRDWA